MRYLLEHNGACKFFGALAMTTYAVAHTHIDLIRPGDTVLVDDRLKTVSPGDTKEGFMGTTLWGDSYRLGTLPVKRAIIKAAHIGKPK